MPTKPVAQTTTMPKEKRKHLIRIRRISAILAHTSEPKAKKKKLRKSTIDTSVWLDKNKKPKNINEKLTLGTQVCARAYRKENLAIEN